MNNRERSNGRMNQQVLTLRAVAISGRHCGLDLQSFCDRTDKVCNGYHYEIAGQARNDGLWSAMAALWSAMATSVAFDSGGLCAV